jgi:3-hydroxyisobutyrate dehydrogenase-like beta-hydroxyacid dehydrogenase
MKVGFIGLGQMGAPIAINMAATYPVLVFDIEESNVNPVIERGALRAQSRADFAGAGIIFLSLPNGNVVESVISGEGGLHEIATAGTIIVDLSTIEYDRTLILAETLEQKDIRFVDAPVSGMQARAEQGTLTVMCGGDHSDIEKLHPYFETIASKVLHMGPTGAGQLTKLINQLLFDINAAALAEILPIAKKLGLDPEKVGEVVNSGTGKSYASEFFVPRILENTFDQGYPLEHAYKDLISGAEISARYRFPTPVLAAATATYQQALLEGFGTLDKGAMIKVFERLLDVEFRKAG